MDHPVPVRLAWLLSVGIAAGCGGSPGAEPPPALANPTRLSGGSPLDAACASRSSGGVRYGGSEVEPSLAVSPAREGHLVATWQQDRWSDDGADAIAAAASFDGGGTWSRSIVPFTRCGGGAGRGGDFDRASDPWLAISADGATVVQIGLAFDVTGTGRKAVLASRSTDGGLTWSDPVAVAAETSPALVLDKPSVTADPVDPSRVYVVWDRLTGVAGPDPTLGTGPAWFSASTDAGASWSVPVVVHDPGRDAQTISNQILVLPDGTLVDVFVRLRDASADAPIADLMASRSPDRGVTWEAPVLAHPMERGAALDPKSRHALRTGDVVPAAAVDAAGAIHVVWEDARSGARGQRGILRTASTDGGRAWSAPVQVNGAPDAMAFRPAIAAGAAGILAVTYYDLRNDVPADRAHTWTTFWLATSADGATWREVPLGGPFDLRSAPDVDGWFLGDYTGLVATSAGFIALFPMSGAGTDLFLAR